MGTPSLLLIGPNNKNVLSIGSRLKGKGYQTTYSPDFSQAKETMGVRNFDTILVDFELGEEECIGFAKATRQSELLKNTPILLVCDSQVIERLVLLFEAGVTDFLTTPLVEVELLARVRNATQLKQLNFELQNHGVRDPLTGLFNAKFFHERLTQEFDRTLRYQSSLACVLVDIDHFKSINDQFGREIGDHIIKHVGIVIEANRRGSDCVARYNSEEFAVLLPATDEEGAHAAMERLRTLIMESQFFDGKNSIRVTCSLGISWHDGKRFSTAAEFFEAAETALQLAKSEGRNLVKLSEKRVG